MTGAMSYMLEYRPVSQADQVGIVVISLSELVSNDCVFSPSLWHSHFWPCSIRNYNVMTEDVKSFTGVISLCNIIQEEKVRKSFSSFM